MKTITHDDRLILAVDIGGTKVAAAVVAHSGTILNRMVEPTLQQGPQAGIEQIIGMLDKLVLSANISIDRIDAIGIGIPAVLEADTDFIIWGPNLKDWKKVDLRGSIENHFHVPVAVEYDGHAAVLGEWWQGAGRGHQSVVSVIIGTGVGGGMILDGHLFRGNNRLAGAAGWFAFNPADTKITAKERSLGCWEAAIAGPGIARCAERLLSNPDHPGTILGVQPGAAEVFEAARQGDAIAIQVVDEVAGLIGLGLANIISLVNPEIIVLGGSVGANTAFLLPKIKHIVESHAQPVSARSVEIVTSRLGADAGILGAAYGAILRLK